MIIRDLVSQIYLAHSGIVQGELGLFTSKFIPHGQQIFAPSDQSPHNLVITTDEFYELSAPRLRQYFMHFGYLVDNEIIVNTDHSRFCNHAENANLDPLGVYAARDILAGEEITWDYSYQACDAYGNYYSANFLHYPPQKIEEFLRRRIADAA